MDDGPDHGLRRDSVLKLAELIEFLPIAIILFDTSGKVVTCVGAKREMIGPRVPSYSRREHRMWEVRDGEGHEIPPSQWPAKRVLRGEAKAASAFVRRRSMVDRRWLRLCVFRVGGDNGFRGGLGLLQDDGASWLPEDIAPGQEQVLIDAMLDRINREMSGCSDDMVDLEPQLLQMDPLSEREREVLIQCAWGRRYKEIASDLGISAKTVEFHRTQALHKLGLSTREDLVHYAVDHGWLRKN